MVILGLGSNLGDRLANVQQAADALKRWVTKMKSSRVLEADALLPKDAPASWNKPFLNLAIIGETTLTPEALLREMKIIESRLGRNSIGRWSPRVIDLDLLAIGDLVIDTPALRLPHPELLNRDFALLPMAELAPNWKYPVPGPDQGKTAAELVEERGYALGKTLRDTGSRLS